MRTIGGGSLDSGDNTSTQQQISPPETGENHAQKPESGDSGDSGDIIPTLEEESIVTVLYYNIPLKMICCI